MEVVAEGAGFVTGVDLFSRCFAQAYDPELDVTQAGQTPVDLKKTYNAVI